MQKFVNLFLGYEIHGIQLKFSRFKWLIFCKYLKFDIKDKKWTMYVANKSE